MDDRQREKMVKIMVNYNQFKACSIKISEVSDEMT